jgi:hypothetical protein
MVAELRPGPGSAGSSPPRTRAETGVASTSAGRRSTRSGASSAPSRRPLTSSGRRLPGEEAGSTSSSPSSNKASAAEVLSSGLPQRLLADGPGLRCLVTVRYTEKEASRGRLVVSSLGDGKRLTVSPTAAAGRALRDLASDLHLSRPRHKEVRMTQPSPTTDLVLTTMATTIVDNANASPNKLVVGDATSASRCAGSEWSSPTRPSTSRASAPSESRPHPPARSGGLGDLGDRVPAGRRAAGDKTDTRGRDHDAARLDQGIMPVAVLAR